MPCGFETFPSQIHRIALGDRAEVELHAGEREPDCRLRTGRQMDIMPVCAGQQRDEVFCGRAHGVQRAAVKAPSLHDRPDQGIEGTLRVSAKTQSGLQHGGEVGGNRDRSRGARRRVDRAERAGGIPGGEVVVQRLEGTLREIAHVRRGGGVRTLHGGDGSHGQPLEAYRRGRRGTAGGEQKQNGRCGRADKAAVTSHGRRTLMRKKAEGASAGSSTASGAPVPGRSMLPGSGCHAAGWSVDEVSTV